MKQSMAYLALFFAVMTLAACGCSKDKGPTPAPSQNVKIDSVFVNSKAVVSGSTVKGIQPASSLTIRIKFSAPINLNELGKNYIYFVGSMGKNATYAQDANDPQSLIVTSGAIGTGATSTFYVKEGSYLGHNIIESYSCKLWAQFIPNASIPQLSNDSLMTLVQRQTFKYFWDYAHPTSGLARERLNSGNTVTTGGSGFGFMAIIVGIERGFITHQQGLERFTKIVDFLNASSTEKFHGAFPHWLNGQTGKAIAFGTNDNGGDLVETAFLIQGLLAVYEYFKTDNSAEAVVLCNNIQTIWKNVEWDWYRKNNENVLYWHWSADKGWAMNMKISGWNEGLLTYVLAAASPTHSIPKMVYDQGWARNGSMANGRGYYGVTLPLGPDYGGPLFFAHYSFLGLNPNKISDSYANYWEQNVAHAKVNHLYCDNNSKGCRAYGLNCWGLTASDIPGGYTASSPTNDKGTIAPTAALASFPYTPDESMAALHFFYYTLGEKMWGDYGFKDAFYKDPMDDGKDWYASSYLAIDQGPIVVMIENYRTQKIWKLFMQNTDVQSGLQKLGFTVTP